MEKIVYHLSVGLLLQCFLSICLARMTITTTDQSALLALREHITLDPHQILAKNWSVGSSVCEWIGVTCDSRHLRVTTLNISNMGFNGTIPPELGNLSFLVSLDMSRNNFHGKLPPELARLRRLIVLNLGLNNLNGEFPTWFGSLHEIQFLSLINNSFTGLIPASISNMSKLETIRLSYNSLQGNIPKEIFNISSLEMMALDDNSFFGSVPDYMCQHLRRLNWLSLSDNFLNGPLPSSLGQCSEMQKLSLSINQFSGFIPKEIWNLKALEILALGSNSLEGKIPKEIGNSTMLTALDLSENNLTGAIPREISNLVNLEHINIGYNQLTGSIPTEIFNFSMVRFFSFSTNQLSGNLPSWMGNGLPKLEEVYLGVNNFVGAIPYSISNSSNLYIIDLSDNKFSGSIPNSLGGLRLLELLLLYNNNLTGDSSSPELSFVTSLTNCKYLTSLAVYWNPLNGILPDSIGNLSTSLESIYAHNCKIRGTIPEGIGNLSSLIILDLAENQLTGPLPTTIGDMENVQQIDLHMNNLRGVTIDYFCFLQHLGYIHLGYNEIPGSIPACFGNITSLRYLYLNSNRFNSTPPSNLWNLKDLLELNLSTNLLSGSLPLGIQNLKVATLIDLSTNHFSGGIPSTIGNMQNLGGISFEHNRLQGSIPESIGKMLSLEALELSHNFLNGSIPMSMESLRYLTYFNVSFNNLTGEIPSTGPFTNFTYESFISNEALCGAPRFHVPPCPSISAPKLRTKKVHRTLFIVIGVIVAVVAMSLGFLYLRYRKKDNVPNSQADLSLVASVTHERISYYKLLEATNGYDEINLLGTGSFGSVYRGDLDDGRVVAIKVFNLQVEGALKSFDVECDALRNLRHRNLTKVISTCSNPNFKALVLEFMPNGNLGKWLYSHNYFLDIMQRLDILIDVASALQYLHYDCSPPVVHCDLKPSNILLDQAMVAHLSDFGIAKLLGQEDSILYTKTLATFCYLAPEYGSEGLVSIKTDVYSFGITMMEVFTRMDPNNEKFGESLSLKSWVNDSMPNALAHIVDANLLRASDINFDEKLDCISSIMKMALNCTRESPKERSYIQDVLVALKKIKLQLQPYVDGLEGLQNTSKMT